MYLSVILPCFNGAETIDVQLAALTRQQWRDGWEVVVCNNGSTDRSMEIVAGYRDRLPGLRIVEAHSGRGPRRGVARSYAVGFAAAKGDAFVLCEADDEVGEGWLCALGNALEERAFVAAAVDHDRLNPVKVRALGATQQTRENGLPTSAPTHWPYANGCTFGLRRSVYERVGDPDEACGAAWDTDYCWRAHRDGIALTFVPAALVHYRLRCTLRGAFSQARSWGRARQELNRKYGARLTSRASVVRRRLRELRALVRDVAKARNVLAGKMTPICWVWGLGWHRGILDGWRRERVRPRPQPHPLVPTRARVSGQPFGQGESRGA